MYEYFIFIHVYVPCACSVCRGQKKVFDTLSLELQMVVSYNVCTENCSRPPETQPVLLSTEPFHQSEQIIFTNEVYHNTGNTISTFTLTILILKETAWDLDIKFSSVLDFFPIMR